MTPRQNTPTQATIKDVAERVGVSRQTVTRAMNNMTGISAETRERVLQVARELRYRPSRFGRGLVKQEHLTLGFVVEDLTNPYYPEVASALVRLAAPLGWNVVLAESIHVPERVELLEALTRQVDAVVGYLGVPVEQSRAVLGSLPVVQLDSRDDGVHGGVVVVDLQQAMEDLADHLVARGCRRPAMITPASDGVTRGRALQFVEVMARHGLDVIMEHIPDTTREEAVAAVHRLLSRSEPIDAIFCFNDNLAIAVMRACLDAGIAVPAEIRVAGVDGVLTGEYVRPQLTTLSIDKSSIAQTALDLVLGMHDGTLPLDGPEVARSVRYELVVRDST